jgi:hypothetical protein
VIGEDSLIVPVEMLKGEKSEEAGGEKEIELDVAEDAAEHGCE